MARTEPYMDVFTGVFWEAFPNVPCTQAELLMSTV